MVQEKENALRDAGRAKQDLSREWEVAKRDLEHKHGRELSDKEALLEVNLYNS